MTPWENVALLKEIRAKVAVAAPPMAMAMGLTHQRQLQTVTLVQSGAHGPARPGGGHSDYPPAAPKGAPPMLMTGTLRRSITCIQGPGGGMVGSSIVGPHTIYAATQEFGGIHSGAMWLWVSYVGPDDVLRRGWRKRRVSIGPHPYVRPSRDAVIASGAVTSAANASFMRQVWGM